VVTALLAIVLGQLIWTSHSVYSRQQSESTTLGTQILQLDLQPDRLGPGGAGGRGLMSQGVIVARKRF
jgi:hypothetical protein